MNIAADTATSPAPPRHRWWTLGILALAVSLVVIDGTIVNVALPTIMRELPLNYNQAQWTSALYALIFSALLLTAGRLADRIGRRTVLLVGVVIFLAASIMAGASHGPATFLAARAAQGVGAALILPTTLSTVQATFTGRERSIAFAVWGSVISATAAIGPLLGGWFTTAGNWRWVFWVNVPVIAVIIVGSLLVVPNTRAAQRNPGYDVAGFLLSAVGFGGVVFGLVQGHAYGWWKPTQDLALGPVTWRTTAPLAASPIALALGVLAIAAFVAWELLAQRTGRSVLLDLTLFRFPSFRWGNAAAMVIALGEFGLLFVLPLYLQNVLGLSSLRAGLVLAAMAVGAFLAGGAAHPLGTRITAAGVAQVGVGLEALAIVGLALTARPDSSGWLVAGWLTAYGFGLGLCSAQLTSVILIDVPADLAGQGSAAQSTTRQLGSALGVAILSTSLGQVLSRGAGGSLAGTLPGQPGTQLEEAFGRSAGGILAPLRDGTIPLPAPARDAVVEILSGVLTDATKASLWFAAVALLLAGLLVWRLPRRQAEAR